MVETTLIANVTLTRIFNDDVAERITEAHKRIFENELRKAIPECDDVHVESIKFFVTGDENAEN